MNSTLEIMFLGATETVTGSCIAFKFSNEKETHHYLVDIGEYQSEQKNKQGREWLARNARKIEAIFITHAHYDHVGYLPELVMKHGFSGIVYCTKVTQELMEKILADSLKIKGIETYTINEVFKKIKFFDMDTYTMSENRPRSLCDDLRVITLNSAHILGSCGFLFQWKNDSEWESLYFSGDIGSNNEQSYSNILLKDFQTPFYTKAKTKINIVLEATYGNRIRPDKCNLYERKLEKLTEIAEDAISNNKIVIFPAFALNRSQEILLDLYYLGKEKIDFRKVAQKYIYSNLMKEINKIYYEHLLETFEKKDGTIGYRYVSKRFFETFNISNADDEEKYKEAKECVRRIFICPPEYNESVKKKYVPFIVSSSGMCDEGKVIKLLEKFLPNENAVIVLSGYQAIRTNGYFLKNMQKYSEMKKFNTKLNNIDLRLSEIKCKIIDLSEFYSGHADQDMLFEYVAGIGKHKNKVPTRVFLNHGQSDAKQALKERLETQENIEVEILDVLNWYNLNTGEQYQENIEMELKDILKAILIASILKILRF